MNVPNRQPRGGNHPGPNPGPRLLAPASLPSPHQLAYLLAEFPSLSETFILREVVDLVGRGLPLGIYALRGARSCRVHADAAALLGRVSYRPSWTNWRRPAAYWKALRSAPGCLLGLLACAFRESHGHGARLRHRLVAFDAAVCFAPLLRACGARHLHAHFADVPTTTARYVATLLGLPFSFTAHAHDIYVAGTRDPEGLAENLRQAAFVVTCTDYNRRYLAEHFPQVPSEKIYRIYHGIDPERYAAAAPATSGPVQILAVGRLQPKKGLHVLLEACALLQQRGHPFALTIAGSGPEKERLVALARRRGIDHRVLFLGELTQEELLSVYAQAQILALPCLIERNGDRDGLPNVILEAMAAGLAVVSTPVSAVPEVIEEDRTGLLVPPEDPVALAAALERLVTDPALRARLGAAGRERVRQAFDIRNNPLAGLFAEQAGIVGTEP